jgi:Raf kinase inhibitor-like YbhB/YbcL family protein
MRLHSDSFAEGQSIPPQFAFGRPGPDAPCVLSDNRNPHLSWDRVPANTRSFVLICVDPDVPSRGDDVNQEGRSVPANLPRVDFIHWMIVDIAASQHEIPAGSYSSGVTPRGKQNPPGPPGSRQGINDFTGWFAADAQMSGDYHGYDGPCPPWNDELTHHYRFELYALDLPTLTVPERFTVADVRKAIGGHVLAQAQLTGVYSLNPRAKA